MNAQKIRELTEIQNRVEKEVVAALADGSKKITIHMATGSGKTNLATHLLFRRYINKGKRVLILSHNWFLLEQFLLRMMSLYPDFDYDQGCGFWSSETNANVKALKSRGIDSCLKEYCDLDKLQIMLSSYHSLGWTLQNGKAKQKKRLNNFKPDVILIDEAHWGKSGSLEEAIFDYLHESFPQAIYLGLSATPKVRRGWKKVGDVYFSDLVEQGLLARPIPVNLTVESTVRLRFDTTNRMMNEAELYRDRKRTNFIVDEIVKQRRGKTVVFAGDKKHADAIAVMLRKRGQSVVTIHSGDYEPAANLEEFKEGAFDIAVTVHMLSEGIDIPEIETIVIARPVQSEIMFAQIVGRGSRITDQKEEFLLIDFHDVTENEIHQQHLFHFVDYYNVRDRERKTVVTKPRTPQAPRLREHISDFESVIQTLIYDPKTEPLFYQALHGLRIDAAQTFGIEFELFCKDVDIGDETQWSKKARVIHTFLKKVLGKENLSKEPIYDDVKKIDHALWNVVYDGSCGFEIVSPILRGREGFEEIVRICSELRLSGILEREGFEVNVQTGTHVHLGWKYRDPKKVQDILKLAYKYEPAFHSLLSPSRVLNNKYCAPVRKEFSLRKIESIDTLTSVKEYFGDHEDRYRSLNLTKFNKPNSTIEIRSHQGTLSEKKILTWLALWMNSINSIERLKKDKLQDLKTSKELLPDSLDTDDVIKLAEALFDLSPQNAPMLTALHDRRLELLSSPQWRKHLGSEKSEVLQRFWDQNFHKNSLIRQTSEHERSGKYAETIFPFQSLPDSLKESVARNLIRFNSLKISEENLLTSLQENFMLVVVREGHVQATAGLKVSASKFTESIKLSLKNKNNLLMKKLDGNRLLEKFERNLAIEKGWSWNSGDKQDFKKLNLFLEDYFQLIYPVKNGHILYSTHVEGNEAAARYLKNGGMSAALKFKSPFSDNTLMLYLKYF